METNDPPHSEWLQHVAEEALNRYWYVYDLFRWGYMIIWRDCVCLFINPNDFFPFIWVKSDPWSKCAQKAIFVIVFLAIRGHMSSIPRLLSANTFDTELSDSVKIDIYFGRRRQSLFHLENWRNRKLFANYFQFSLMVNYATLKKYQYSSFEITNQFTEVYK